MKRNRLRNVQDAPVDQEQWKAFLVEYEAYHTNLREADPQEWALVEAERREFDGTLMDGLLEE